MSVNIWCYFGWPVVYCVCIAEQEMLVTVAEQCEQKIMDIREQEKQGMECGDYNSGGDGSSVGGLKSSWGRKLQFSRKHCKFLTEFLDRQQQIYDKGDYGHSEF